MKNILPPPTLPVLPSNEVARIRSGINSIYDNTMVDLADGIRLTALGFDFNIKRPPILFSDDDLWRAIIKVLAFNHRHTRNSIRKTLELILSPMVSQATILDREYTQTIIVNDILNIQSGANIGNYTVVGITPHELIFPAATFGTIPEAGPITYAVGEGPAPIVGGTIGTQGRLYTASDGTERFVDNTLSFINIHEEDLLTQVNTMFPQFGHVIFDKNSPVEETKKMAFYESLQSGLMKLKSGSQADLVFTHPKYSPIRSSVLAASVSAGALTLDLLNSTNFPANLAAVDSVVAAVDSVDILQGVNVGTYAITVVTAHQITINTGGAPLTVTGKGANNNYKITPVATPLGAKGTIFSSGGVVSVTAGPAPFFAVFRDDSVTFNTPVDPENPGPPALNTGYSVHINRGELTEEVIQIRSLVGTQLNLLLDPGDLTGQTSLLRFPHEINELVEIDELVYSASSTYFISSGTATGGGANTLVDGTNPFILTLLDSADVEILTGPAAGDIRTIILPFAAGTITVSPAFSAPPGVGDTYRIIKRYIAGIDDILYLDDTSGLPASNFTIIVDRGTEQEEVLYISANDITVTPNTLTISNNDIGTAFCALDHSSSFIVEAAQVLVLGCDWDIIETRATGEYTIAASVDCVPDIDLNSFFLHDHVDLTKVGVPAAHVSTPIVAGDTEFTLPITGANSFESALENVGDKDGILCRALKVGTAGTEEEVFATKQKNFTSIREFIPSGTTVLPVKNASQFEGLTGANIVIGRNTSTPEFRTIGPAGSIDIINNTITISAPVLTLLGHNIGTLLKHGLQVSTQ